MEFDNDILAIDVATLVETSVERLQGLGRLHLVVVVDARADADIRYDWDRRLLRDRAQGSRKRPAGKPRHEIPPLHRPPSRARGSLRPTARRFPLANFQ